MPTKTDKGDVVDRLLDQAAANDVERETANRLTIQALERQVVLWQRTTIALISVLLVLVAGVTGVSVSGKLPGIGDITIKDQDSERNPVTEPAPVAPPADPVTPPADLVPLDPTAPLDLPTPSTEAA